jgi:hypothetical protein
LNAKAVCELIDAVIIATTTILQYVDDKMSDEFRTKDNNLFGPSQSTHKSAEIREEGDL